MEHNLAFKTAKKGQAKNFIRDQSDKKAEASKHYCIYLWLAER